MTDRYAVAYLRRSSADDANPGDVSREAQEAAVRTLAQRDGVTDLRLFTDWNRSADEAKESKRVAFVSMLAAIERSEVSTVYAAAVDRLYRSMATYLRLIKAATAHGTRIVTARENRDLVDDSPMGIAWGQMATTFTELELNTIKARNRGAAKTRRTRGDKMGHPPYGKRIARDAKTQAAVKPIAWEDDPVRPLAPVLEAYRRAGSALGACRLLNEAGVPTALPRKRDDGDVTLWGASSLTLILVRAGVIAARGQRRHYSRGHPLAGLVRCHCGRTMTPDGPKRGLYCARAKVTTQAVHGPGSIADSRIMPIVRAEADRLRIPFPVELGQDVDPGRRDSLAERKRRLAIGFADRLLDEAEYAEQLAAIGREVEHLDAASEIVELPALDWSQPPEIVNGTLRAIFEPIQLRPDMSVLPIKWRVPEWRSAEEIR